MAPPNKIGDVGLANMTVEAYATNESDYFAPYIARDNEASEYVRLCSSLLRDVIFASKDKARLFGVITDEEKTFLRGHTRFSDEFIEALAGQDGKRVLYERIKVLRAQLSGLLAQGFFFSLDEKLEKLFDEELPPLGRDATLLLPDLLKTYKSDQCKEWHVKILFIAKMAELVKYAEDGAIRDEVQTIVKEYRERNIPDMIEECKKGHNHGQFVRTIGVIGGEFSLPYLFDLLRSLKCPVDSTKIIEEEGQKDTTDKCLHGGDISDSFKAIGLPAVRPLLDISRDKDWRLRFSAVDILEKVGLKIAGEEMATVESIICRIIDLLKDPEKLVAKRAYVALESLASVSFRPLANKLSDPAFKGRKMLAMMLCHLKVSEDLKPLHKSMAIMLLEDRDKDIKRSALTALASYDSKNIPMGLVASFLLDKDLKEHAVSFFITRTDEAKDAIPLLEEISSSDDEYTRIRKAAATAIENILYYVR